jgi:hypothetical protein
MSLLVILLKTGPLKKEQERGVSTYALALIRGEDVACVDIESAPPAARTRYRLKSVAATRANHATLETQTHRLKPSSATSTISWACICLSL